MKIRLVKADDIASIAKIHIDNWKNIYQESFPSEYLAGLNYNDAGKEWLKYLEQEDAFIYIAASDDDSVCGFVACKFDRVPVRQLGLIWNDISCLCKKNDVHTTHIKKENKENF